MNIKNKTISDIESLKEELRDKVLILKKILQGELDVKGITMGSTFDGLSGSSMTPCRLKFKGLGGSPFSAFLTASVVKVKKDGSEYSLSAYPFNIEISQLEEWF